MRASMWLAATAAFAAVGCGGTEPLSVVKGSDPVLALPLDSTAIQSMSAYNESANTGVVAASDGFNIFTVSNTSFNVLSPADGIVSAVDNTLGAAAILIYHGPHISSRISRLQQVTVQPGTVVQPGSVVGISTTTSNIAISTGGIHFTVFHDAAVACPLSFLSTTAQTTVGQRMTNSASEISPCL